ncbi:MAG: 4-hydroxy-tetrahydrodipicolinate reductase [candidate division Zixibacteria bacterium]|nr:4-hydroxy-tetrahydrodipicolinate reductase [candidate division Zixibacteria bacterium]
MIDIVISGAAGRMGQAIARIAREMEDIRIVGALGASDRPYTGRDLGTVLGGDLLGAVIESDMEIVLKPGRTWVEFSTPAATLAHTRRIAEIGLPTLVGTTGFSGSEREELYGLARVIPLLVASNTSLGANLLFSLAETAARSLGTDFDMEIVEAHHRMKRDAPSGTARQLVERMATARNQTLDDVAAYGRNPATGRRQPGEIGIHALRGGDIVGEHTAIFFGNGERIEIAHRVRSIDTFAHGALHAVRFLKDRPPGLYTMGDVLKG